MQYLIIKGVNNLNIIQIQSETLQLLVTKWLPIGIHDVTTLITYAWLVVKLWIPTNNYNW